MSAIDIGLQSDLVQIFEQSENGIIVTDPNQKSNPVIYVNKKTCDKFGYSKKDFLGKNCSFLQAEDTKQKEIEIIKNGICKKEAVSVTLRNYTKNGKLIYNHVTISPILDENKNIKYFLGVQKDVTKEVELQRENKQLQEEKIIDAQYNAIGKLFAGLSHEINTPLTIIKGNLEMLKMSVESLDSRADRELILEDFEAIQNNLNRIKNITESMREVADTKQYDIKEVNLYRAIIISLRLTHNRAKHIAKVKINNILFDLDLDRDHEKILVNGDYKKLEQAFIAVINNALDQLEVHSTIDDGLLDIEIFEDKDKLKVVFTDNGGGIDPSLLKDIFKPFRSKKTYKGLGIGLSVVKKIMDEHNYKIDIDNYKDGVKVTITVN